MFLCALCFFGSAEAIAGRGLRKPEAKLAEQTLTLPHTQSDPILLFDPCGQRQAIPETAAQPNVARHPP